MPSKEELADYTIQTVWNWIGTISRKQTSQPKPEVILPYGSLIENQKATILGVGQGFKWVALLPNGDLVIGPEMISHADSKEEKDQLGIESKEFRNDMIFLKKAMVHGTINLNSIPIEKKEKQNGK